MTDLSGFSLDGKVAVITGASEGIGRGIALGFARHGATVVLGSRTQANLDAVCAEITDLGQASLAVQTDVNDASQIHNLIHTAHERFGRIDVMVNNAGNSFGDNYKRGPLLELTGDDVMGCFGQNVKSGFLCCKEAVPIMQEQGNGSIINVASMGGKDRGWKGWGPAHMAVYGAAKAAIIHLTKSMAAQWGPEVRVNCINPGYVSTPRVDARRSPEQIAESVKKIGMGRFGTPDDVAGAAIYLASDAASWVSGTVIDVYGGDTVPTMEWAGLKEGSRD